MLNRIRIGSFYNVKSIIHNMNPTSKIICTLLFIIITLLNPNNQLLLLLGLISLFTIIIGKLPIILFIKQIYSLKYIYILIFIYYYFNSLSINNYLFLIIQIQLIFISIATLTLTTKSNEITNGIEEFFSPFKFIRPFVAKIALNIALILRFFPIFQEEKEEVLNILINKKIYYNKFILKIKYFKLIFLKTLSLTFKRIKQIKNNMKVRLYDYNKKRTNYNAKNITIIDGIIILIHLFIFAYITLERLGIV